jgi:hypothetical protein
VGSLGNKPIICLGYFVFTPRKPLRIVDFLGRLEGIFHLGNTRLARFEIENIQLAASSVDDEIYSQSSRINSVEGSGEGDGLADMVQAADPGYDSFDAHAEAGVGDAAVFAQVEVPLEGIEG